MAADGSPSDSRHQLPVAPRREISKGHFSQHPAHGNCSEIKKSSGTGKEMNEIHKEKDVFQPSLLDMETGRRDRWRDEERDAHSSVRKDRWRDGDIEHGDTCRMDRWTENSSSRQFGEARCTLSDHWTDSGGMDTNYDQRRESKWNTRWGPDDKETDGLREKWSDSSKDSDMHHEKGLSLAQAGQQNGSLEVKEPSPKIPKLNQNGVKHDNTSSVLRVKKLSEKAVLPKRGSPLAAGYDLSSSTETKVPARGKALVPTDLSIAIPEGTYARIAPRSGLAWKHSMDVGAGVIDADYRGPVGVILFNHSDVDFEVKMGDRIAQLIIEKIATPDVLEVENLDYTVRGEGGFGSTGV